MPFKNIEQPEIINIDNKLRLRKPGEEDIFTALAWYQNPEVLFYSDGISDRVYDIETIKSMHKQLNSIGELYYIEILIRSVWKPIGDVTLSEKNTSIAIGNEAFWGKGIGKKVMLKLIERAKYIHLKKIPVWLYKYNKRSQNLFISLGFSKISEDALEESYELNVDSL